MATKTLNDYTVVKSAKEIAEMQNNVNEAIKIALSELFPSFIVSVEKRCAKHLQDCGMVTANWKFGDAVDDNGKTILALCPLDEKKNIIDVDTAVKNLREKCLGYVTKNMGGCNDFAKFVNDEIKRLIALRDLMDDEQFAGEIIRRSVIIEKSPLNTENISVSAEELFNAVTERIKKIELAKSSKQAKAKAFKASLLASL